MINKVIQLSLLRSRSLFHPRTLINQCFCTFQNSVKPNPRTLLINKNNSLSKLYTIRFLSNKKRKEIDRNKSILYYFSALGVLVLGSTYAAVPLYRMFCQATSYGGTVKHAEDPDKVAKMKKIANRPIKISFNADVGSSMRWNFKPQQNEITVYPGETALAFYTATNPSDVPIIGISTYNVVPFDAGQYFNKIQCFCFEEQQLNPHEEVDMPVFFFIDPDFVEDPRMENVDNIILSYTFFESKDGFQIPVPSYALLNKHSDKL